MKKGLLSLAGLAISALALAQLEKHKDWAKSPEAYFLTSAERQEWSQVKTDQEAEKFIALYWAKRDPNPATANNEFRDEMMRRIAAADEQFKMRKQRGAESARGRLLVVLGPPSRFSQQRAEESANPPPGEAGGIPTLLNTAQQMTVTWTYDKGRFDRSLDISELRARILVDPEGGYDQLQAGGTVEKAIAKLAEKSIVNPNPGAPPAAAAPAPDAPAPGVSAVNPIRPSVPPSATGPATRAPATTGSASAPPAVAAPMAALPAVSRTALEGVLKEKKTDPSFWGGSFISPTGQPFYALQLYVPAEQAASLPPAGVKLGGVVVKESGEEAQTIWTDANLLEMKTGAKSDRTVEHSIVLPAGSYRGAFALFPAEGNTPLVPSTAQFTIEPPSEEFRVSPLILTNALTPLTKRPGPTDPFVFGVDKPIRVDPKGNRQFTKDEGLWYFYTVSNPALPSVPEPAPPAPAATPAPSAPVPAAAPEGPKPRIMTRVTVLRDGKPAFAPLSSPADLQPLSPGRYGGGLEIPLATFEPGHYTFVLNVRDLNAPKDSPSNKGVERKDDFIVLMTDGSLPPAKPAAPAAKPKPTPKKP